MPQLFALALVGAGFYAGYRWLARATGGITEVERTRDDLRHRPAGGMLAKDMGTLTYDPASGVYRPVRGD